MQTEVNARKMSQNSDLFRDELIKTPETRKHHPSSANPASGYL